MRTAVSPLEPNRRPLVLKLHLYGGLLRCGYLVIYGITSLAGSFLFTLGMGLYFLLHP